MEPETMNKQNSGGHRDTNPKPEPAQTGLKITAPVNSIEEVDLLAAAGAGEFYCGIVPPGWLERYSRAVWLNRRGKGKANISNYRELSLVVEKAHSHSIPVHLTLNAPYYTGSQVPLLLDLVKKACDSGINGFIVSDPGLILALRESGIDTAVIASSVAAIRNSESAAFFKDLGVTRIILPRHLSLAEIRRIRESVEGPGYEVFILNDGCVYEEGFCSTTHAAGPFCTASWQSHFFKTREQTGLTPGEAQALETHLKDYRRWTWYMDNCGSSFSQRGYPNGPCGLCALLDFYRMGIDSLKVVGREATLHRKMRSVQMVKAVLNKVKQGLSRREICGFALEMRGTQQFCASGYMCYYSEAKGGRFSREQEIGGKCK